MTQKERNLWKRPFGTGPSGTTALVGFAALLVLLLLAVGLLITLDNVIFRFYADMRSLIGISDASAKQIVGKILWLVELLLSGVLVGTTLVWGYQTAMQVVKPRKHADRKGDDPVIRYLLVTVALIALVELLKRIGT